MAYDWNAIGNQIDGLLGSGNEAQAWAMFNGLSGMGNAQGAGGFAGGLDSYLRTRWGDERAKQWVNNMDTKYGNTNFDPKTGQWAGMGQAAGQGGTIAGWDASQYNPGGMGVPGQGYVPSGYGSGAGGFGVGGTNTIPTPSGTPAGPPAGQGSSPAQGAGSPWDFFNDEGYKFRRDEGMKDIQGSAAAGGALMSGKTLKDLASFNSGLASQEYGAAFDRFANQRNFNEGQFQDRRNYDRGVYQDDRDFGENRRRYDLDFGENRRRYDQGFGEDRRRNDRDFDFMYGRDQRDYETGLDRYNNEWDYRTGMDDRNWRTSTLMDLARMGLGGTQGSSGLAQFLAQLYGGNLMAGAGAGGAGAMGNANNMNNMIGQLLQWLQGQQLMGGMKP